MRSDSEPQLAASKKPPSLLQIGRVFFLAGLTSYGGPALIPRLREILVDQYGWVNNEQFKDSLALCQVLPGPITAQIAGHSGWRLARIPGAIVAEVAYVLPSSLIMMGLSVWYFNGPHSTTVRSVFDLLGAVVVSLIAHAAYSMGRPLLNDIRRVGLAAIVLLVMLLGLSPPVAIVLSAVAGVVIFRKDHAGTSDESKGHSEELSPLKTFLWPAIMAAGLIVLAAVAGAFDPRLSVLSLSMGHINLLSYGGGYTAAALLYHDVVLNPSHAWLDARQYSDGLAMGQLSPGPILITSVFIGYRVASYWGALIATLYIFAPSAVLLIAVAPWFERFRNLRSVKHAIDGLVAAFLGMLIFVLLRMAPTAIGSSLSFAVAILALVAIHKKIATTWIVIATLVLGIVLGQHAS